MTPHAQSSTLWYWPDKYHTVFTAFGGKIGVAAIRVSYVNTYDDVTVQSYHLHGSELSSAVIESLLQ